MLSSKLLIKPHRVAPLPQASRGVLISFINTTRRTLVGSTFVWLARLLAVAVLSLRLALTTENSQASTGSSVRRAAGAAFSLLCSFIPRRALVPCGRQKFARLLAGQCVRVIPDRRVGNRRKARSACAAKRGKETAKNNTARAFGLFYVNFEVELAADASRRKV